MRLIVSLILEYNPKQPCPVPRFLLPIHDPPLHHHLHHLHCRRVTKGRWGKCRIPYRRFSHRTTWQFCDDFFLPWVCPASYCLPKQVEIYQKVHEYCGLTGHCTVLHQASVSIDSSEFHKTNLQFAARGPGGFWDYRQDREDYPTGSHYEDPQDIQAGPALRWPPVPHLHPPAGLQGARPTAGPHRRCHPCLLQPRVLWSVVDSRTSLEKTG